jgi:hypothetical protein
MDKGAGSYARTRRTARIGLGKPNRESKRITLVGVESDCQCADS